MIAENQWKELRTYAESGLFTEAHIERLLRGLRMPRRLEVDYSVYDVHTYPVEYREDVLRPEHVILHGSGVTTPEYDVVQFQHPPALHTILRWQGEDGWRAPDPAEVLAYIAQYTGPEHVAGICNVVNGFYYIVVYMSCLSDTRGTVVQYYDPTGNRTWHQQYYFIRVKK